jgi:hypothetical protein
MFYTNMCSPVKGRTIALVAVAYSSPDSSYTQLCAVYTCPCGAHSTRVGRLAALLPGGWMRLSEETCLCAHCAEKQREGTAGPVGSSAS